MYFSKLEIHPEAMGHSSYWKAFQNEYRVHQTLWKVFPSSSDQTRDFIYRMDMERGRPRVYLVSARKPDTNAPMWSVQTRDYMPKLRRGQRLKFSLRANPVVTREKKRHDVIMDAKHKARAKGQTPPDQPTLVQEAGSAWLAARQESLGVSLETVLVEGYRVQDFYKPRGGKIRIATCDFQGTLRVQDPERLTHTLTSGIGRAKAFGCGLMLVRLLPE